MHQAHTRDPRTIVHLTQSGIREKENKGTTFPECSEISVSSSVKGYDNILTMEILSSGVDNLEVDYGESDKYHHGRFQGYNDKHKKLNGDGMVTSGEVIRVVS